MASDKEPKGPGLRRGGYETTGIPKPFGPERPPPKEPKGDDKKDDTTKDPKDRK